MSGWGLSGLRPWRGLYFGAFRLKTHGDVLPVPAETSSQPWLPRWFSTRTLWPATESVPFASGAFSLEASSSQLVASTSPSPVTQRTLPRGPPGWAGWSGGAPPPPGPRPPPPRPPPRPPPAPSAPPRKGRGATGPSPSHPRELEAVYWSSAYSHLSAFG